MRASPVKLRAELRHCTWDEHESQGWAQYENVVEEFLVYRIEETLDYIYDAAWREKMRRNYSPARYIADCIAMTRNIAATWDLVKVTLDGIDVTAEVNEEWDRWYVSRRAEYV